MANEIAIFRINYKSDFILTLNSDAGWMTPFCIKFWTGAPSQAYFVGYDGTTYTHCAPVGGEPTKLRVQFDDHHLPIGDLKFQIGYHFTVADFPTSVEDEVLNQASVIIEVDDVPAQVMLDLNGETAPEIEFSLPAYANEAQRIANEEQRIANEEQRIANEEARIAAETIRQQNEAQRIAQETARVNEFATLKSQSQAATSAANTAAALANEKAQLAADKAVLAGAAATLANAKAQLAADKAALADAAAQLANEKAAMAQQKSEYAQQQGGYAKDQGDYAKNQGDYAKEQGDTALADHQRAGVDHGIAVDDHTQAGNDHTRAESDHGIAVDDHTKAGNDHTRAESDHGIAVDDHTQAGNDHTRAESDHGIAADDHTQAGNDHTRAESDHTRAESDHAAVEVYIDSLGVFDLSKHNAVGGVLATYADLDAALTALNALDSQYKYGGMSFKFVQSSDNKYVQYRYMSSSTAVADFINVANWQGVDDEPTAGSDNLVKSGGVYISEQNKVDKIIGTNIIDPNALVLNKTIGPSGTIVDNQPTSSYEFAISDYIPVKGSSIVSNAMSYSWAASYNVYDNNFNKIRTSVQDNTYTYQEGDAFVVFGFIKPLSNTWENYAKASYGATLTTDKYIPYMPIVELDNKIAALKTYTDGLVKETKDGIYYAFSGTPQTSWKETNFEIKIKAGTKLDFWMEDNTLPAGTVPKLVFRKFDETWKFTTVQLSAEKQSYVTTEDYDLIRFVLSASTESEGSYTAYLSIDASYQEIDIDAEDVDYIASVKETLGYKYDLAGSVPAETYEIVGLTDSDTTIGGVISKVRANFTSAGTYTLKVGRYDTTHGYVDFSGTYQINVPQSGIQEIATNIPIQIGETLFVEFGENTKIMATVQSSPGVGFKPCIAKLSTTNWHTEATVSFNLTFEVTKSGKSVKDVLDEDAESINDLKNDITNIESSLVSIDQSFPKLYENGVPYKLVVNNGALSIKSLKYDNILILSHSFASISGVWSRGMTASKIDTDWVAHLNSVFEGTVNRVLMTPWEGAFVSPNSINPSVTGTPEELLPSLLDAKLSSSVKAIFIMVGANIAVSARTYENVYDHYLNLIEYCKNGAPNSDIYLCSPGYTPENNTLNVAIQDSARNSYSNYISTYSTDDDKFASYGEIIENGNTHQMDYVVNTGGVVNHPSDIWHLFMTNNILKFLGFETLEKYRKVTINSSVEYSGRQRWVAGGHYTICTFGNSAPTIVAKKSDNTVISGTLTDLSSVTFPSTLSNTPTYAYHFDMPDDDVTITVS